MVAITREGPGLLHIPGAGGEHPVGPGRELPGPAIGAAGLILAGAFASLTLAGNTILSQIGFAVSCGIALSAFVMAMFFSPSLTALVGHPAWWPGRADKHQTPGAPRRGQDRRPLTGIVLNREDTR